MKKILFSLFVCLILIGCGEKEDIKQPQKLSFNYENFLIHKTSVKYQSDVILKIQDGKIPNIQNMEEIFERIIQENQGFENYFTTFYFNRFGTQKEDVKLFQFSKLGKKEVEISPLWKQSQYNKDVLVPKEYNKLNGFIKYSDVDLKLEEPLSEIEAKIGKTIFEEGKNKIYMVFNDRYQIMGYLVLVLEKEKLSDLFFIAPYQISDEEHKKIESYFLGDRTNKSKVFYDIGGINIRLHDFTRKFMLAKQMIGDPKNNVSLPEDKDLREILYDGDKGFLIKFNVKNDEINKIELIQFGEKTDETYRKFIEESMFIYILSKNNIPDRGVYNTLEKLGFSYEQYEKNENYSSEYEEGNIKYKIIITSETCIFEIENI